MRPVRPVLLLLALAFAALSGRPVSAAEPGCNRWDLEVSCQSTPGRVLAGDPFTVTVTVRNTGDVALANVTIQLRGDLGAKAPADATLQSLVEKLEPGESRELAAAFTCATVGVTRVIGGARDALGWAASNCACTVDVIGLPAIQSDLMDKDLQGTERIFAVGETFVYVLEVKNVGTSVTPDLKATFSLPPELSFVSGQGEGGVTVTGAGPSAETSTFALAAAQSLKVTIQVKVLAAPPTNFILTKAGIQTTGGVLVAEETESTTIKS
jgi:uncharacterized repeat protein (TIGR01451 family)